MHIYHLSTPVHDRYADDQKRDLTAIFVSHEKDRLDADWEALNAAQERAVNLERTLYGVKDAWVDGPTIITRQDFLYYDNEGLQTEKPPIHTVGRISAFDIPVPGIMHY